VCHSVLQCVTACCSMSQCVTVCCSVSQCVAVRHSVLQYIAKIRESTHRCHPYPLRYPKSKNYTPHHTPMIKCRALLMEYGALLIEYEALLIEYGALLIEYGALLIQYGGISSQKSKTNKRLFQKSCFCVAFIFFCLALFFHLSPFQMCIV